MTRLFLSLVALVAVAPAGDLTGTYTGSLTLNDRDHGGAIVIKEEAGKLAVLVGPDASKLSAASELAVDGNRLRFQVSPPGHTGDPWKCDVVVKDGRLTGSVVLPEAGSIAQLNMTLAVDVAGTYTGSLLVETPDGERDMGGAVVLGQEASGLVVKAGPNAGELLAATNVKLDGRHLTFDVQPPNGGEPWKFDVQVEAGRITGTVIARRDGDTRTGKVNFTKQ